MPNPLPTTGSTFTSLGHEAVITVPANANVLVTGTAVLGTTVGASLLALDQCYKANGGTLQGGGYFLYVRESAGSASAHSLTRIFGPLAAGTYSFGLCYATSNGNWNANDYITNTVLVFN